MILFLVVGIVDFRKMFTCIGCRTATLPLNYIPQFGFANLINRSRIGFPPHKTVADPERVRSTLHPHGGNGRTDGASVTKLPTFALMAVVPREGQADICA